MSYKKSIHLKKSFHDELRKRAYKNGSTMRQELNEILKKELKSKKKNKK